MKKLLVILALGAFAACNSGENKDGGDTTVVLNDSTTIQVDTTITSVDTTKADTTQK